MVDKKKSTSLDRDAINKIVDNLDIAAGFEVLDRFLRNTPIAFAVIDIHGREILWTSDYTKKLFNASGDDYLAHIWKELFRTDELFEKILRQLEVEGTLEDQERVFINTEGEMFVALLDFNIIEVAGRQLILADLTDITERKQAEADVSHEAEADKLLSNITSQLLDVNTEDATYNSLKNLGVYFEIDSIIIQEIPQAGVRISQPISWTATGGNASEKSLIGDVLPTFPWFEENLTAGKKINISSPEDLPDDAVAESNFMTSNGIKSLMITPIIFHRKLVGIIIVESLTRNREWTPREVEVLIQYGNAIGAQIVRQQSEEHLRTAKVRAEEALGELEGAQDQLIRVEKMAALGDMVAGIAHETNTPLGIAVTTTSTLRAKSQQLEKKLVEGKMKKSDLTDYFDLSKEGYLILENNLQRAAELIRSFKRVAVDVTSTSIQTIELNAYLYDILLNIHPRTKKFKNLNIAVDCPLDLEAQMDPGALAQIITNMTLNSLIHAYEDDVTAEGNITIKASSVKGKLQVSFADDGAGLTNEVKEKIFEPYFTTKRGEGGSGLGMSIICKLVEKNLNGSISVASELGKGTEFTMTFPLKVYE